MMKRLLAAIFVLLGANSALAQALPMQGAGLVSYFGTDPTSRQPCRPPSFFYDEDAPTGQRAMFCEGTTYVAVAGGSGASTSLTYLVTTLDASLSNERRLIAGTDEGLTALDGGANGDFSFRLGSLSGNTRTISVGNSASTIDVLFSNAGAGGVSISTERITGVVQEMRVYEDPANGNNYHGLRAPSSIASDSIQDLSAAFLTFLGTPSSANFRAWLNDDTGTGLALFVGSTVVDSIYVPAGSMDVDGTQCTKLTPAVINGGPMILAINCADNASGIVYFEAVMPDGWANSGIVTVEAEALTIDATVTGGADDTVGWDVSCMARGDGETINSTWGTAQNLDVTFATQYVEEHVTSADITPNDFEAGDTLYCRAVIDTTTTDATTADMRLKGFKVEFTRAIGD